MAKDIGCPFRAVKWIPFFFLIKKNLWLHLLHMEAPRSGVQQLNLSCTCSNAASFKALRRAGVEPDPLQQPEPLQLDS